MRLTVVIAGWASALLLTGCSSHEPIFENTAPPRLPSIEAVRAATDILVSTPTRTIVSSPPAPLAALTLATASYFQATRGAPVRALTKRYADALLDGRIVVRGNQGFYAESNIRKIDPVTTLRAGLALVDAYGATGDSRYAVAVRGLVRTAFSSSFGLQRYANGYVMRTPGTGRRSIALTALAAAFARAADPLVSASLREYSDGALRTVTGNQAALARWYAFVGTREPMSLEQWGLTLTSLARFPAQETQSILAAGVPAIYGVSFLPDGTVRPGDLTVQLKGRAIAMQALASGAQQPFIARVFERAERTFAKAGEDGGSDDSLQAELALAFAIWYRQLTPG